MERRKILLGSGAALTTALAGCTGSDSDDDDSDGNGDENGTEENGTEENGTEENGGDGTEETDGNGDENGTEENDASGGDDIPGFDATALDLESDTVSITSIERAGETVEVVATSETTDYEELYAELEPLADDLDQAIVDVDAFAEEIEAIEWVVDHDEMKVVAFTVETAWLVEYREGELSKTAFLEKVKATAE